MSTVTLILVFRDSDGVEKSIIIKKPKLNLTLETITSVMELIVAKAVLLTATGSSYAEVVNAYYKTVTINYPGSGQSE